MKTEGSKLMNEIYELRLKGLSYNEIAKRLNCAKSTISYYSKLLKVNEPILKVKTLNIEEIELLKEYYKTHTKKETAECFNVSESTVFKYAETKHIKLSVSELKKRNYLSVKTFRQKIKIKAVEYKGGRCEKCGYNKCIWALEFHHINKNEKEFTISHYSKLSWNKIENELDKCELLCSNCHKEVHYNHWDVTPIQ